MNPQNREALVLGKYLVHDTISDALVERYFAGIKASKIVDDGSSRLLEKAIRNPWLLPFFDSGLALTNPNCTLRKKLFLMLAIVEATPDYCHLFLQNDARIIDYIKFAAIGVRAIYRAFLGLFFIRIL